mmetsp:Transcript_11811/g.11777  ORF Transcript_11811/g.11777 Transcript_11811/m.11777 type:complete len:341 (+) Transcript_11811:23-1045(+)
MNSYVHYMLGLLLLVTVMRVNHFMHSSNEAFTPTEMTGETAGISSLGEFQNGKNPDKRFLKDESPNFVAPEIKQEIEEPVDNASEAEKVGDIGEAQEDPNKQTEGEQNTSEVKKEPNVVYIPLPKTTDDLDNAISKLGTFFKLRYQGQWTYDTEGLVGEAGGVSEFMAAVHNITTTEGRMAKVNFGIQLLQGQLRENVDGYHVSFELSNYTVSEKSITIEAMNAEVTKERIQLFTKSDNGYCTANVTLVFTEKEGSIFEGLISLKSKHKNCVVESTSLVSSQFEELINQQRGINYNIILFMILCFYCYAMIKQIKKVEDNEGIAKRFSIITIGWNIIWNF